MAKQLVKQGKVSIRLACDTYGISETCYRYQARLDADNRIIRLAAAVDAQPAKLGVWLMLSVSA